MEILAVPFPLQPVILTVLEFASAPDVDATHPLLSPVIVIAESIDEFDSEPKLESVKVNVYDVDVAELTDATVGPVTALSCGRVTSRVSVRVEEVAEFPDRSVRCAVIW